MTKVDENFLYFGEVKYPIIQNIPVVLKDPEHHLMGHYNDVMNYIDKKVKQNNILNDFAGRSLRVENKKRLESKIKGVEKHLEDIQSLMNDSIISFFSDHYQLKEVVDDNEFLIYDDFVLRYWINIFRDWFFEEGENEIYAEKLKNLGKLQGKCLVLGSGASRLAYDLAAQNPDLEVVASDLNYLFLHAAEKINRGEQLELTHLPPHPTSNKNISVNLKNTKFTSLKNLHFLNCDFRENIFQAMSFDTILAPWFFDVIDVPLELSLKRVNYLLKNEGKLIYWGPYSFQQYGEYSSYTPEEIGEIATEMGFKTQSSRMDVIPYLNDPYNAQSRVEKLFWGEFQKSKHLKFEELKKTYKKVPSWIHDHNEIIPLNQEILHRKKVYETFNELYKEIDGQKTMKSLAKAFGKKIDFTPTQAKAIIELHFERIFKGS